MLIFACRTFFNLRWWWQCFICKIVRFSTKFNIFLWIHWKFSKRVWVNPKLRQLWRQTFIFQDHDVFVPIVCKVTWVIVCRFIRYFITVWNIEWVCRVVFRTMLVKDHEVYLTILNIVWFVHWRDCVRWVFKIWQNVSCPFSLYMEIKGT